MTSTPRKNPTNRTKSARKPRVKAKPAPGKPRVTPPAAKAKAPRATQQTKVAKGAKQERLLALLKRPEGASVEEMMRVTDWQPHSVRGFLAGTVKRQLGFALTSSKAEGDARRYRIELQRSK